MEKLLSFTNDILKENGLSIEDKNLLNLPKYKEIKNYRILDYRYLQLNLDYIVEKNLSQKRLNEMKSGIFDINVKKDDQVKKITKTLLYEELANEFEEDDVENIRQILSGSRFGIKIQLKKYFDFDIDKIDDSLYQKLKFKKMIYKIKRKEERLYKILEKYSAENTDNSFIRKNTEYGDVILELKNETRKEVSLEYWQQLNNISLLPQIWKEELLDKIEQKRRIINGKNENSVEYLRAIQKRLDLVHIWTQNIEINEIESKHIFESFLFKIILHEQKSFIKEIINSTEYEEKSHQIAELSKKNAYKLYFEIFETRELKNNDVIKEKINKIKIYNVFSEEELKEIYNEVYLEGIKTYINFKYIYKGIHLTNISLLEILVVLKEIFYIKKMKVKYRGIIYFGQKNQHKSILSKIKKKLNAEIGYDLRFLKRIDKKIEEYTQTIESYQLRCKIETAIDKIVLFILSQNNIQDLEETNKMLLRISRSIVFNDEITNIITKIKKELYALNGYSIHFNHYLYKVLCLKNSEENFCTWIKEQIKLNRKYNVLRNFEKNKFLYKIDFEKKIIVIKNIFEKNSLIHYRKKY